MVTPTTTDLITIAMTSAPASNLSIVADNALSADTTASPATMKIGVLHVILPTGTFRTAISRACPRRDTMSHTSTHQTHATLPVKAATAVKTFALRAQITLCILSTTRAFPARLFIRAAILVT